MKKSKLTVRALVALLLAAGVLAAFRFFPAHNWLDRFLDWASGTGFAGIAVFIVVYVAAAVFFLPGSILTLGAGAVFGLFWGTAAVSAGSTLGAAAAFLAGRYLARERVARWASENPKFAAIDSAVGLAGGRIVLLTRLSPIFPYNVLNYLFGVTRVGFWPYLVSSWLGMFPGTLLYVYLGVAGRATAKAAAGPGIGNGWEAIFWTVGLAATALLTFFLTRLARRALAEDAP
jgi:uncharacterized membrane protein YdjX (TVP38/TMEM64 family)